jgi:hypothetical protein
MKKDKRNKCDTKVKEDEFQMGFKKSKRRTKKKRFS